MDENDRQEGIDTVGETSLDSEMNQEVSEPRKIEITDEEPREEFTSPEVPVSIDTVETIGTQLSVPDNSAETAEIEPIEMEATVVEAEIEPETSAIPAEQPSATAEEPHPDAQTSGTPEPTVVPATPATNLTTTPAPRSKKRLMIIVAASVLALIIAAVLVWWFFIDKKPVATTKQTTDTSSAPIEQPKLGVAITVIDGTVEYKQATETEWTTATTSTQPEEGDSIRTGAESRAVLTLDDGSAVRLDANTVVEIVSLAADNVEIKQQEGTLYSRIVPSDRTYVVAIDQTTYTALGTAFMTFKKSGENGVQVYQSAVKASTAPETISEGKQFYDINSDASLQGKVTSINIDALVDNTFVNWNMTEDEKDTTFKTKLGILPQIQQRSEELKKEREVEDARKQAEKEAAEKAAKEKAEQEKKQATAGDKVTRGTMTLTLVGPTLKWNYTGKAMHGYKVVYSKTNQTPIFGTDDAIYYDQMGKVSTTLTKKDIGTGKFYVRVCAYTAGTESEACVDYSNIVIIDTTN